MSKKIPHICTFGIFIFLSLCMIHSVLAGYSDIPPHEAYDLIEQNPDIFILDVRTTSEYNSGYIEKAVLIPVSQLQGRIGELDTNNTYLVYCKSGGRSATASNILITSGFQDVFNLLGGITSWINAGYPIETPIHYSPGDLNKDGRVNLLDIIPIGQQWESTGPPGWIEEDLNSDGLVNILDLIIIGHHWTG